jgi:hypothetical protein
MIIRPNGCRCFCEDVSEVSVSETSELSLLSTPGASTCLDLYCETVPRFWSFELTTITNAYFCPDCLLLNREFLLEFDDADSDRWVDTTDSITTLSCSLGVGKMFLNIRLDQSDCITPSLQSMRQYELALTSWECLSSNIMNDSGDLNYKCGGWPSTITVEPA